MHDDGGIEMTNEKYTLNIGIKSYSSNNLERRA